MKIDELTDRELVGWWTYWVRNYPPVADQKQTSVELFSNYLYKQREREAPIDFSIFGGIQLGNQWINYIRTGDSTKFRNFDGADDRDHGSGPSGPGNVSESNLDDRPVVHPEREG